MYKEKFTRISAYLFAVLIIATYVMLGQTFDFPAILREAPSKVFETFLSNQSAIRFSYYIATLSGLIFVVFSQTLISNLDRNNHWIQIAAGFGIITGLVQSLGYSRWVFMMPILVESYHGEVGKQVSEILYGNMNGLMGMGIGENLGWVGTAIWTSALSLYGLQHIKTDKAIFVIGLISSVGILCYSFEQLGGPLSSIFANFGNIFISLWTIWVPAVSIVFTRKSSLTNKLFTKNAWLIFIAIYLAVQLLVITTLSL